MKYQFLFILLSIASFFVGVYELFFIAEWIKERGNLQVSEDKTNLGLSE